MSELPSGVAKAFDFASELAKQQITVCSAVVAALVGIARFSLEILDTLDYIFLFASWLLLFLSIAFGIVHIMALTYQLTRSDPSIVAKSARSPGKVQSATFVLGILFTILFGVSAAIAQDEESGTASEPITDAAEIVELLPLELQEEESIVSIANTLAAWNRKELEFPSREELQPIFSEIVANAMEVQPFGYEDEQWGVMRRAAFADLPATLSPDIPVNTDGIYAALWTFMVNLDDLRENGFFTDGNTNVALFALLGRAQQSAIQEEAQAISARHLGDAAFLYWTTIYPWCAGDPLSTP